MQQPNFTTPHPTRSRPRRAATAIGKGTTPSAHHGSTPSCFTPNATPPTQHPPHNPRCAPPPSSPSAGPRYPWLHPLLPLLALARVRGWRTVCDGDLKEGDEGSDSATPTPTPAPPRRSLPLRTSDGRAVDRVHRAWSLPTAIVREGARANSRAHRSEARTLEVSTVLRSSGRALRTLAPRKLGPAAPPRSIPTVDTLWPTRRASRPSVSLRGRLPTIPVDSRRTYVTLHSPGFASLHFSATTAY